MKIKKISNLGKITALPTASNSTQNFGDKSVLEEVVLPDTLTSIPHSSFSDYINLKKINISSNVTSIGNSAFEATSLLSSIVIPNQVTVIGDYCFQNSGLGLVVIGLGVLTIGGKTFAYCSKLKTAICRAKIPPTITSNTFQGNSIAHIYVPDASVTAYQEATNWSSYASRIKAISDLPIDNPEVYEEIKEYLGGGIVSFADANVRNICVANFDSDGNGYLTLDDVEKVTSLNQIFKGNSAIRFFDELEFFTGLTSIFGTNLANGGAFGECSSLESIKIPSTIIEIGNGAFANCSSLASIGENINQITKIGNSSFQNCSALNIEVILPNLTSIGASPFQNTGITRVLDLGQITTIAAAGLYNQGVFYGCPNLDVVILPETISTIGKSSFGGNTNLRAFICKAVSPPTVTDLFLNGSDNAIIYVPDASVEGYIASWTTYYNRIKGISALQTDNPALYNEIKDYLN